MRLDQINIRDPFIYSEKGTYYLYGTRGAEAFVGKASGLDVYVSKDLQEFEGPFTVFERYEGFFSDRFYWAPEVYRYRDRYYMFATFTYDGKKEGTASLIADSPMGPFKLLSDKTLTPENWRCLDGTLYISKKGEPYMVFAREWREIKDGTIYRMKLNEDLSAAVEEPVALFAASEGKPLVRSFFFGRYVTDGPFLFRTKDDVLHMIWSSYGKKGYNQLLAHSDNNEIDGNWTIDRQPLFENDGGHGMVFEDGDGKMKLVLHYPNKSKKEHPILIDIGYENNRLIKIGGSK